MDEEEIVISGVSGRFPESRNLAEFEENLWNGKDMVTEDSRRWPVDELTGKLGLPRRSAKLLEVDKFDAQAFGLPPKQVNSMDPQMKMLIEVAFETLVDAGLNPMELKGEKFGVYCATDASETNANMMKLEQSDGYQILGCDTSMFASRINYTFGLTGPSFSINSACSSSLTALSTALDSIKRGVTTGALVCGAHLQLLPQVAVNLHRLHMTSQEGFCRTFDADGKGYVRAEAVGAVLLQRRKDAKRCYATVVGARINTDGYKPQGIFFPNGEMQRTLLKEFYEEVKVNPHDVEYVEAHGTGTQVGDPQEAYAIASTFCQDRPSPVWVGSVKSNMGHAENAAGLCQLAKCLLIMERREIPANLHFKSPNKHIPALVDGRIKVPSEHTKYNGGMVAINSFGFGGVNAHVLIKPTQTPTTSAIGDITNGYDNVDSLPKLYCFCARNEETLGNIAKTIQDHVTNDHVTDLILEAFGSAQTNISQRGFLVVDQTASKFKEFDPVFVAGPAVTIRVEDPPPIWFIYSGMGTQWSGMAKDLMDLHCFRHSIDQCADVVKEFNIDLIDLLTNEFINIETSPLKSFLTIASMQIALTNILKLLGVSPSGILGHSFGEVCCGYADGSLTLEQTMVVAYLRGKFVEETDMEPGAMAAIGDSWDAVANCLPHDVHLACDNSADSVTISGKKQAVLKAVKLFHERGIFADTVKCAGVAFHTPGMIPVAEKIEVAMSEVLKHPKMRSDKWVSSSNLVTPKDESRLKEASAWYFANNLVSPVKFGDKLKLIPENAIVVEISPHAIFQSILTRSLPKTASVLGLMSHKSSNKLVHLLSSFGRLHNAGAKVDFQKLSPNKRPPSWPVPRGTPMLSPLVAWSHQDSWPTVTYSDIYKNNDTCVSYEFEPFNENKNDGFLADHKLQGRSLFPMTAYIELAWRGFCQLRDCDQETTPVWIQNIKLHQATFINNQKYTYKFDVYQVPKNKHIQLYCDGSLVMEADIEKTETGTPFYADWLDFVNFAQDKKECQAIRLEKEDFYKQARLRGYDFGPNFQNVRSTCNDGHLSEIKWSKNWIQFLDAMFQTSTMRYRNYNVFVPVMLSSMRIDPIRHAAAIQQDENGQFLKCYSDEKIDLLYSGGVEFRGLQSAKQPRRLPQEQSVTLEKQIYVPYFDDDCFLDFPSIRQTAVEEMQLVKQSLTDLIPDIPDDSPLISCCSNSQILSSLLYLVILNRNIDRLKYCQINPQNPILCETVDRLVCLHPQKETEFTSIELVEQECTTKDKPHPDSSTASQEHFISHFDHKSNQFLKQNKLTGSQGLVILDKALSSTAKLSESIQFAVSLLANDGFMLISEITDEFAAIDAVYKSKNFPHLHTKISHDSWVEHFRMHNLRICAYSRDSSVSWITHFLLKPDVTLNELPPHGIVEIEDFEKFNWLPNLQEEILKRKENSSEERLWLKSSNPVNGVLSLLLSIQMENKNIRLRCIYNATAKSERSCSKQSVGCEFSNDDIATCIQNDMLDNAYRDGVRCFKCFIWLEDHIPRHLVTNAYLHPKTLRNLSSIDWVENDIIPDHAKYAVYYAALNFKDIMLATGKLNSMHIPGIDVDFENIGSEFSGRCCRTGKRVFGMPLSRGLATYVRADERMVWNVPDHWTLAEAATVPVAYLTAFYALICRGRLRRKDTILIHSGTGGLGQAALHIAISMECNIFTTVGSEEKRQFLMQHFPQVPHDQIGDSRSNSFLMMVLGKTNGRGADVILNSLAFEKLQNSLRCLALNGRFLELGKTDLITNEATGLGVLLRNVDIIGVVFETLLEDERQIVELKKVFFEGIENGVVKPIKQLVYHHTNVVDAFRLMAQGKHIGKVLIQMRDEEKGGTSVAGNVIPSPLTVLGRAVLTCDSANSYLITGGLGGLGIEITQWLVDKGAKKIFLTSRVGVKSGYQKRVVAEWKKRGASVEICSEDIGSESQTKTLLKRCNETSRLTAIFHLAQSSKDGIIENQTPETFKQCAHMKLDGTRNLDKVSKEVCHHLKLFVIFSSYSSGRGSRGQASYAWGNGCAEQIVNQRRAQGHCGTAIQWGAVGDVGMFMRVSGSDNSVVMRTLHMQRIFSVFEALETLIFVDHPVVSSFIKAKSDQLEKASVDDLLNKIKQIFGALSHQEVDQDVKFGQLGLDSLMVVEMQDIIEKDYGLTIPQNQLRELTLNDVRSMLSNDDKIPAVHKAETTASLDPTMNFFGFFTIDNFSPNQSLEKLNDVNDGRPLFLIHGNDLTSTKFKRLASLLQFPVYGLQIGDDTSVDTYEQIANSYIEKIKTVQPQGLYRIAAYSIGSALGVIMANILTTGNKGLETARPKRVKLESQLEQLIIIDGSFKYFDIYCEILKRTKNLKFDTAYSNDIDDYLLDQVRLKLGLPERKSLDDNSESASWQNKINLIANEALKIAPKLHRKSIKSALAKQRDFLAASYRYKNSGVIKTFDGSAVLIKCQKNKQMAGRLGPDLGLNEYIKGEIKIYETPGSHESMILDEGLPELAEIMNKLLTA